MVLASQYRAAQRRWSGVDVDRDEFAKTCVACEALGQDGADEVYLALGCAGGDPEAMRYFEREYVDGLRAALRPLGQDEAAVAEVKQRLRIRLLVATPEHPPRILSYVGKGRLGGLVEVAAARLALNFIRDRRPTSECEAPDGLLDALDDPELQQIKRTHLLVFKSCFEHAVEQLTPRQRTLLRLHLLDRLSIDEIGRLYTVHRSTAARQLAAARATITDGTRRELERRLDPDGAQLRPLLALLHSRLDLSLSRILDERAHQEAPQVTSSSEHVSSSQGKPSIDEA